MTKSYTLHQGRSEESLKNYPDNHFDSVVCDPPYLISFLGKDWDHDKVDLTPVFKECLRVLKPGGHILAFSAARTYHKLATSIEEAGFEIRDQIMWIYSSGFPKSQDVGKSIDRSAGIKKAADITPPREEGYVYGKGTTGFYPKCPNCEIDRRRCVCGYREVETDEAKQWAGWGTNLKPAHEPIVMARKPTKLSIAKNVQKYGVGAINVDATRIQGLSDKELNWTPQRQSVKDSTSPVMSYGKDKLIGEEISMFNDKGRFPSNVLGDIPDYQKYFYCPKVSRKERHVGFEIETLPTNGNNSNVGNMYGEAQSINRAKSNHGNNHPTVKPVALMDYLIKLVTPKSTKDYQCKVLDPFMGSGSTGLAATALGHHFTGCDLDANYIKIAATRIEAWNKKDKPTTMIDELFTEEESVNTK